MRNSTQGRTILAFALAMGVALVTWAARAWADCSVETPSDHARLEIQSVTIDGVAQADLSSYESGRLSGDWDDGVILVREIGGVLESEAYRAK